MPAIGQRVTSVSVGPSRFVRQRHDGQSRFVNMLRNRRGPFVPPASDAIITDTGNYFVTSDGNHIKVEG